MFRVPAAALLFLVGCYEPIGEPPPPLPQANATATAPNSAVTRPVASATRGCRFETTAEPVPLLVVSEANQLIQIRSDGAKQAIYTFGATRHLPAEDVIISSVVARAGFLAASAYLYDASSEDQEVALFDRSGAVVWSRIYAGNSPTLYLASDGTLAIDTWDAAGMVVTTDGTLHSIPHASPIGPVVSGEVPVRLDQPASHNAYAWFDLASGATTPLLADPGDSVPEVVADRLTYFSGATSHLSLITESPLEPRFTSTALPTDASPYFYGSTEQGWVLITESGDDATGWLRANVRTGDVEPVHLAPPTGLAATRGIQPALALLDDGSVTQALDDGIASTLYASTDLGVTWIPIGAPVPLVEGSYARDMRGQRRGQTTLVTSSDQMGYVELAATSEVVRDERDPVLLESGVPTVWPRAEAASLSPDGSCVAFWRSTDGGAELAAFDVASGAQTPLLESTSLGENAHWEIP